MAQAHGRLCFVTSDNPKLGSGARLWQMHISVLAHLHNCGVVCYRFEARYVHVGLIQAEMLGSVFAEIV